MERSSKAQSRQRWAELRDLWNEFDPIGVMDDPSWPRDEYEAYLGPTLRRLVDGTSIAEIAEFLEATVRERMGLKLDGEEAECFAGRLDAWFRKNWRG